VILEIAGCGVVAYGAWKLIQAVTADSSGPTAESNIVDRMRRVPLVAANQLVAGKRVRVMGIARKLDRELASVYTATPCLAFVSQSWAIDGSMIGSSPLVDKKLVAFTLESDEGNLEIGETAAFQLEGHPLHGDPETRGTFGEKTMQDLTSGGPLSTNDPPPLSRSTTDQVLRDGNHVAVVGTVEIVDGRPRLVATEKYEILLSTVAKSAT
jgi:hypothetical protein